VIGLKETAASVQNGVVIGDVKGTKNQYKVYNFMAVKNILLIHANQCRRRLHLQVTLTASLFMYVTQNDMPTYSDVASDFSHIMSVNHGYVPRTRVTTSHSKRYPSLPPYLVSYFQERQIGMAAL
jgi:hypothetical protein